MVSFFNVFQLEKLISEGTLHHDVIRFHYYVQYHLYMQVSSVCCCCYSELLIELLSLIYFDTILFLFASLVIRSSCICKKEKGYPER
jgi:hypothetical protein